MSTSLFSQQTLTENQVFEVQKPSACPYHRALQLSQKLRSTLQTHGATVNRKLATIKNVAPGLTLYFKVAQYGINQYLRAFFETFDSSTSYVHFRTFGFLGKQKVVLRDGNMVAEVLKRTQEFDRVTVRPKEYLPFNKGSVLGAGSGEKWLKYRKAFAAYFSKDYVKDIPKIKAITEKAIEQWKLKGEINLLEELYKLVVEIRGEVFFQKSFGCFDSEFNDNNFASIIHRLLQAPTFVFGGNPDGIVDVFHKEVRKAIEAAHQPGSVGYICQTKLKNGEFTSEEVLHNAAMYILAQAPTMVLFWVILRTAQNGNAKRLATHPDELIQHLKEELRIHPAVHTVYGRRAQKDVVVNGLTIKKGTEVVVSPMYIHQNPKLWKNPARFNPSNWKVASASPQEILHAKNIASELPQQAATTGCPFAKKKSLLRYLPFGYGKHQCQGRKYAVEEIFTIAQTIFEKVDMSMISTTELLDLPVAQQSKLHIYNCPREDVRLKIG